MSDPFASEGRVLTRAGTSGWFTGLLSVGRAEASDKGTASLKAEVQEAGRPTDFVFDHEGGPDGDLVRHRLHGEQLAAPALIDLKVASVWRGLARGGHLDSRRVGLALDDLRDLPQRVEHTPFLARCWELRDNLTIYVAVYVALAEALQAPLLTGDGRLLRSTGPRCAIEVIKADQ
jgi:predicted nucleic acid-binding protein